MHPANAAGVLTTMPPPCCATPDSAPALDHLLHAVRLGYIGHQQQLGIIRMTVPRQRIVSVELAEAPAEGDVLLARDLLVAKQQDAAFQERGVDLVELVLS